MDEGIRGTIHQFCIEKKLFGGMILVIPTGRFDFRSSIHIMKG